MPPAKWLVVGSGGAAHGLIGGLQARFAEETGFAVNGTFDAVGRIAAQVRERRSIDVVLLTAALIADLTREGHLAGGTARDIGTVHTAVAVRAGDAAPDIATADGLRAALLGASEIFFPDPKLATAGIHFDKVMAGLGIRDAVAERLRPFPNGTAAMASLAASTGERPIGCTQLTEILATPGLLPVGPLPPGCELATVYTAAVGEAAASPDAARRMIALLTSPSTAEIRRRCGFE